MAKKTTKKKQIWVVGDLQGWITPVHQLIKQIKQDNKSFQLYFVGDLCNRGAESLETLQFLMNAGDQVKCILGNHDLHLLATYAGIRSPGSLDTLEPILKHPDCKKIIDWLRHQPLARYVDGHLMVHAGVQHTWSVKKTLKLAKEVEQLLQSDDWKKHLAKMYGNTPTKWSNQLKGADRTRMIINTLTRMRFCDKNGRMELQCKAPPSKAPKELVPWFEVPHRKTKKTPIVFGHWSALGLVNTPYIIALDTGYVWGGKLTAMRLSDRKIIQIKAPFPSKHG